MLDIVLKKSRNPRSYGVSEKVRMRSMNYLLSGVVFGGLKCNLDVTYFSDNDSPVSPSEF